MTTADTTPKAGKYTLTASRWRRSLEGGGYQQFWQGDVVDLTDREAERLVGGTRPAFQAVETADVPTVDPTKKTNGK